MGHVWRSHVGFQGAETFLASLSDSRLLGGERQVDFEQVSPTDDAVYLSILSDDGETRHPVLEKPLSRSLDGLARLGGNRFPAHDLVGSFVERGPVSVQLGKGSDKRADGFE